MSLVASERMMEIFKFPKEAPESVAYPPNFYHKMGFIGSYYVVRANSFGIRYPEIPLEKNSKNELRIAVIGDSFTEGFGVEEDQRFSSILERQWSKPDRKVLFINCGVPGAGPVEYFQIFSHIALAYNPDKLLLVLYDNDLIDSEWLRKKTIHQGFKRWLSKFFPRIYARLKVFHYKILMHEYRFHLSVLELEHFPSHPWFFADASINPQIQSSFLDAMLAVEGKSFYTYPVNGENMSSESDFLDSERSKQMLGAENEMRKRFMLSLLSKILEECKKRKISAAFAYIPHANQYDSNFELTPEKRGLATRSLRLYNKTNFEVELEEWARNNSVMFLNFTPYLREATRYSQEPLNFREDEHWNARGHALAASILSDWLNNVVWPGEISAESARID